MTLSKNERKRLSTRQSCSHFQYRQPPKGELQRKYYTMRGNSFQAFEKRLLRLLENDLERKKP